MIYLDSSVLLAYLLAEDRRPPGSFWAERLISSRLLELEVWTVVNRQGLSTSHGEEVGALLSRVAMIELIPEVLSRAREPFNPPVRTLDALHLAAADFVRGFRRDLRFATYDTRLSNAALAMRIPVVPL